MSTTPSDTEMLDWLQSSKSPMWKFQGRWEWSLYLGYSPLIGDTLREAIAAAMKEQA